MPKLPDLEGLAIFAKVVELRSFAGAAADLQLSKATVSKAVTRLEQRLGTRLLNRTSRRLALTDAGKQLTERAAHILQEGEAAESDVLATSATPRGLVRLAAPMSFGLRWIAPVLPEFLAAYPEVSVDLHLSDASVDIIGEGFDMAVRIAAMPDSSLVARRLCAMDRFVVAAPGYLKKHGRPTHPLHIADHVCLTYAYLATADTWHFKNARGEDAAVRPNGRYRVNNGDAMVPALLAGVGIAVHTQAGDKPDPHLRLLAEAVAARGADGKDGANHVSAASISSKVSRQALSSSATTSRMKRSVNARARAGSPR